MNWYARVSSFASSERRAHRRDVPCRQKRLVGSARAHEIAAPPAELDHRALDPAPEVGQLVDRAAGRGREPATLDEPSLLEVTQARGEEALADPGQRSQEIGEAARTKVDEVAQDQERPALADDVEGLRDGAVLLVASAHLRTR